MAKKKNSFLPEVTEDGVIYTVIGFGANFVGTLEFSRPLQINGNFEGEIKSNGILLISETATVKATIKANTVILGGHVIGNIEAKNRVEMLPNGKLTGNVRTPKLQIADGVIFDGNCEMVFPDGSTS